MEILKIRVNKTVNTGAGHDYATDPTAYITLEHEDYFIFSSGNDLVKDGEAIPTSEQLTDAATYIETSEKEIPKCFLAHVSENKLYEIFGANSGDHRFVFCFSFLVGTDIEPELQIWDNGDISTNGLEVLGEGISENSWVRVIATTSGSPGSSWVGDKLSGDTHKLLLNEGSGKLLVATDLYCNIHIDILANYNNNIIELPKFFVNFK